MACVGDELVAYEGVHQPYKGILHCGGCIKMPSSTNSVFRCINGVNGVRAHDTIVDLRC